MPKPSRIDNNDSFIGLQVNNRGIAVKRERTDACDPDIHGLPLVSLRTIEQNNLVTGGATHHACGVFFARTLNKNANLLLDEAVVFAVSNFVDESKQPRVAFLDE
jgi:hypothetical protein